MKKRLFGILLSFALMLTMMPVLGLSLTAYADDDPPYAQYKNTTTVITFDGKYWYLIDYDASTVTLLAKDCVGESAYDSSGTFVEYSSNPTVKGVVDTYYTKKISDGAKAAVSGDAMFLLKKDQADATSADVRKCSNASNGGWWLRSPGNDDYSAGFVYGVDGYVSGNGHAVKNTLGVRPALKLNLSKVVFDSTSKTFSIFKTYPLWVGGTQVTSANKDDPGNRGWSYTPADGTTPAKLTLNNYTYTSSSGNYAYSAIYANENLILELEGTNNVDSTLVEGNDNAIFVNDQLNVQGEGSLDAKGKRYGIYAYKGLTIEGCNVIARSTETTEGEKIYRGISSGNKGDDITIKNATVKANAVVGNAIDSGGNVIIENSTVEAHSTNHIGIYSFEGTNVEIKYGSNVIASGGDKAIDGTVKNAIAGTGWTDTTGTQGKADIAINSEGQKLETYKKVQFPAVPEPVKESTITYDLNGGTLDGQTGIVTTTVENGKVITLPAPTRDGYTFDYWEGSKYNAGDRYTVNGDHTFKAIWKTGAGGNGSKGGSSKKGVNTGDENTLGAWIVLLAAALAGTTGMVFARKRRND